jgi:RimJ/RimL family protein N-acetyltransferase
MLELSGRFSRSRREALRGCMSQGVISACEELGERQRRMIRALKGLEGGADCVPFAPVRVSKDGAGLIGSMTPIDRALACDEQVVDALTRWRRRFGRFFLTQFEPTNERTRSWLERVVLPDDSRILFLIKDDAGELVGHLGVCNVTRESAELDNYMRGRRGGDPKLMLFAGLSLIGWVYGVLGIERMTARVLANNHRTLALYDETGCFERGPVTPHPQTPNGQNGSRLHDADVADNTHAIVRMTLDTRRFLSLYPWMVEPSNPPTR